MQRFVDSAQPGLVPEGLPRAVIHLPGYSIELGLCHFPGSPVFLRYRGFFKNDPYSAGVRPDDWFGEGDALVGVYSGRLGASEMEAQLGVVWKADLVDQVVKGGKRAAAGAI